MNKQAEHGLIAALQVFLEFLCICVQVVDVQYLIYVFKPFMP